MTENAPQGESPIQELPPRTTAEKLHDLGITPEVLRGKKVFDINGGEPTFDQDAAAFGAESLQDFNPADPAVEGDEIPVDSDLYDLVVATNGPLQGNFLNEQTMAMYLEALRIVKPEDQMGEVRVANPFQGWEPESNDPEDWQPESDLAYYLEQQGYVVSVAMTHPDGLPDQSYLTLRKKG